MAAIKKRSLVDQVYETLREDILTLKLPLGSKVNVNELQEKLGVSCTPIREAINRLKQEGLVVYENNVGAHVLTLNAHDVEEIQQLAMALHCTAIQLAMERGERKIIISELERHLKEYREAKTAQSEVTAVNRFVGTFYHHCGNQRLDRSMLSIQGQQLLLRYLFANNAPKRAGGLAALEAMLSAARVGDAAAACDALQRYTDATTPLILASIPSL